MMLREFLFLKLRLNPFKGNLQRTFYGRPGHDTGHPRVVRCALSTLTSVVPQALDRDYC